MRILVTGSRGFIGGHVVSTLMAQGHEVVRYGRGGGASADPTVFAGPAEPAMIETTGPWPEGIEALVHLAARIPARRDHAETDDDLFQSNVEWPRALTARARAEGVKRILLLSSANVHGLGRDVPYSEDDPLDPPNVYARSKRAAEEAFWSALGDDRGLGTVLRPPPVFGKGGHGPVAALVKLAKSRMPLPLKGLGGPRSMIAADHLAAIISLCLTHAAARGETFLVADDGPMRAEDIIRAIRRGLGRPASLLPAPTTLLRMAATAAGRRRAWDASARPYIVDASRLKARLGWNSPQPACEKMRMLAAADAM
jgi:UDP-glucose 4-epimerase